MAIIAFLEVNKLKTSSFYSGTQKTSFLSSQSTKSDDFTLFFYSFRDYTQILAVINKNFIFSVYISHIKIVINKSGNS